ncbi:MAG: hypothetical protein JWO67_6465 [Streptosporangiaceae bacterium]|nr:hypothetical protein [Streptosporangiaceae bacterium]
MGNGIATFAKGRFVQWSTVSAGSDAILVILLKSTGLVADATMKNYATVAAVLAGGNVECDFSNYARKIFTTGLTITVSTGASTATLSMSNYTWNAAGGAANNTIGKLITAYRPTSTSTDAQCIPMTYHDCTATTTGSDLLVSIASTGLALAS